MTLPKPPESTGFSSSISAGKNPIVDPSFPPLDPSQALPQDSSAPLIAPPWTTVSFWLSVLGTLSGIVVAALTSGGKHITIPDSIISSSALLLSTVLGGVYTVQAASTARHVANLRTMTMAQESKNGAYLFHTLKGTPYRG